MKRILTATACLVLTACGANTGVGEVHPQTREIINNYSTPNPDIEAAYKQLVEQCLMQRGVPQAQGLESSQRSSLLGISGIFTSEDAARDGYPGTYKESSSLTAEQQSALYGSSQSPTSDITLSSGVVVSVRTDGCVSVAEEKIYGSLENATRYKNFINEMKTGEQEGTIEDIFDAAGKETSAYKACITDKTGFTAETPEHLAQQVEEKLGQYRLPGQSPHTEELNIAVTDYKCQQSSKIVEKTNKEYLKRISQWLKENEEMVLKIRDIEEAAQQNAIDIVNS
ncbi:hypothetical protein [Rothia sp. ZJ932]|uniref:hypothetical protein n=1 Tax=Rothia sp. ZJ932 TaxID=2810516 RepID=UPI00196730D9|nr:hypothetical protein [Rothia sp. ZJ932]QRZ61590.1 hypothetical protein JR346_00060 [Rothia sp. ZJ932]